MKDLLELCKKVEEVKGESVWIDNFSPPTGYYLIVNNDNTTNTLTVTSKNRSDLEGTELYSIIKERMFYEGMIMYSANKVIKNKSIHSVTSNTLVFKVSSLDTIKKALPIHIQALTSIIVPHKKEEDLLNEFNGYIDVLNKNIPDTLKKEDRLIILKNNDLSEYITDFKAYLRQKVYVDNKTECVINEESFGVLSIATSLNDKKIFAPINPYITGSKKSKKSTYRYSLDDCLLFVKAFKLDCKTLNTLVNTVHEGFSINYSATGDITFYETHKNKKNNVKKDCNNISIIFSNYETVVSKIIELDREELFKKLNILTFFQLENVLKVKDGDYKYFIKTVPYEELGTILLNYKNILNLYFLKNGNVDIIPFVKRILHFIFEKTTIDIEMTNFKNIQSKFDLAFTLLNYLDKTGGYENMAIKMNDIWNKLITSKDNDCEDYEIESDEEFFFLIGQTLKYLSMLSESSNKSGLLIQDIVNLKTSGDMKKKLLYKYNTYLYKLPTYEKAFINVLSNSLIQYKIDEPIKINSNEKYKLFYSSGIVGANIFFQKKQSDSNIKESNNDEDGGN